jgi:hypothetical protein
MERVTSHVEYGIGGVASGAVYTRTAAYNADSQVTTDTVVSAGTSTVTTYNYASYTYFPSFNLIPGTYAHGAVISQAVNTTPSGLATSSTTITNAYVWLLRQAQDDRNIAAEDHHQRPARRHHHLDFL